MRSRIITLCAVRSSWERPSPPPHRHDEYQNSTSSTSFRTSGGKAAVTDPKLVNPWGLAMGKTLWVSNTGTGTATVYSGSGQEGADRGRPSPVAPHRPGGQPRRGASPSRASPPRSSSPAPAARSPAGTPRPTRRTRSSRAFTRGADYKGLALAETDDGDFLLAADFANGRIARLRRRLRADPACRIGVPGPAVPRTYSPFNVEVIGGSVCVAYALRDPETGKSVAGSGQGLRQPLQRWSGRLTGRIAAPGSTRPWADRSPHRSSSARTPDRCWSATSATGRSTPTPATRHLGALRDGNGKHDLARRACGTWSRAPRPPAARTPCGSRPASTTAQHGLLGLIRPAGTGSQVSTPSTSPHADEPFVAQADDVQPVSLRELLTGRR